MTQSRREVLSLAVAAVAGAQTAATQSLETLNRQYLSRYELSLAARGAGFRAKVTSTAGRVFEADLAFPDASDPFLKMAELALSGKGRMMVELDNDGRTVRNLRFEAP